MIGANKVAMSVLRKELAGFLRRAKNGERVIVTVDGKPFAQIGPLEPNGSLDMDQLVASGLVNEPTAVTSTNTPTQMSFPVDVSIETILMEMRR
ncbi:MAG: type II toxin-antitoxin system prevent-host-death family antitoxin [Actinomycetota bacterium]